MGTNVAPESARDISTTKGLVASCKGPCIGSLQVGHVHAITMHAMTMKGH